MDGFNLAYISNPGSFEDIVELLVPELRRRNLVFEDYAVPGGCFRENLLREPGQKVLRKDHYGSKFKFEGDQTDVSKKHPQPERETCGPRKRRKNGKIGK